MKPGRYLEFKIKFYYFGYHFITIHQCIETFFFFFLILKSHNALRKAISFLFQMSPELSLCVNESRRTSLSNAENLSFSGCSINLSFFY